MHFPAHPAGGSIAPDPMSESMYPNHKAGSLRGTLLPGLLALAALVLSACGKSAPAPEPVRAVKVITAGVSASVQDSEYAAEVRPRVETRLGFQVAGRISQRSAEPGQRVAAGAVLARLDPQDYQLAAQAAQSQVAAALTQRDVAAAEFRRYTALKEQNFISGAELERREAALRSAQSQLEQAQAQAATQGNQARYTTLVAPAAGVITAVEAEPGQVVSAGTPVLRLAQDGPRDAVFAVPEDRVQAVRAGLPVLVRSWGGGASLKGQVREVAASADPVTRTFQVKVALPADAPLALGTTVYVAPQLPPGTSAPAVIKLPTTALRQEGQSTAVWILDPATMTVSSQAVQVGGVQGNEAVISGGLKPGQQVVATGVHVLNPGQKVTIFKGRP